MDRRAWWVLVGTLVLGLPGGVVNASEVPRPGEVLEGDFELEVPSGQEGKAPVLTLRGRIKITPDHPFTPAASEACVLQIVVVPWAQVFVDEKALGRSSQSHVSLQEGTHTVRFEHPDYQPVRRRVVFLPGQTQRLVVDLAEEATIKRQK